MPLLDDVVVRFDADIRPLSMALNKAEKLVADSMRRMEKSLSALDSRLSIAEVVS